MAPRLTVVLAVGAVACASLTGCGDTEPPATSAVTPSRYIAAVESLLEPPGRLASTIAARAESATAPVPARRRLQDLIDQARTRLRGFRALRVQDPVLRRQRDRLAGAYARLIPRMEGAAGALATDDRAAMARAVDPFLDALRALPSDVASPASR